MKIKDLLKDVENVELTPEQEKQIKDYLGIKDNKRFVPNHGDIYYFITGDGYILDSVYCQNYPTDKNRLAMGNCFKTKADAELAIEKNLVYQELKQFADENNDPIDWNDKQQAKYTIYYDYSDQDLVISSYHFIVHIGTIYFSSVELAQKALKKIGEKRVEKYLFGVE